MALSRLLLLLLCVVSSEVPNVQTRPIDFVCDAHARRNMNNMKDLEVAMVGCSGSDQLPSFLQLPCVRILKASWDHKSQKRAEVRGALGVLLDGVGRVRTQTKLSCQSSLLERLEHGITNYLHIVTNLDITGDLTDPDPGCPSQQSRSLTQVLQLYGRLLRGKLEWLSLDLRDSCLDQR
ncbi:uncharacterized protein LOC121568332 isoform X2 [Coregonus clupeaformis]|uniref:uncharacterized protein LOC121568332 isoform X2 n=1 Tax=Coregonus clupeaformis TaxID=59861 RepID=UPI001E1C5656|nr:uncharacterized protein LOC121568332 isoform X2 [Coregonus clupeaformis]